jgi:hypothetical protein
MRLLHQIPPNTYDDDLALTPRDGPQAVLGLMSDITEAALAANIYLLHPTEVESTAGKPRLVVDQVRPERSLSMGPEVAAGGPVPATLSYSVAAIAALATLGTLEPAPDSVDLHRVWVDGLRERLKITWSGLPGADPAVDIIGRCMAFDPGARPHPKVLVEEIARVREVLQRVPGVEPKTPVTMSSRSGSSGLPTAQAMSHPLVPYAMVTVVLAGLALAIALCTFGAVMGQFADELATDPKALGGGAVGGPTTPVAAPSVPMDPVVAPASLFDRFDRAPPPSLETMGLEGLPGDAALQATPLQTQQPPAPEPAAVQRRPQPAVAPPPPPPRPRPEPVERPKAAPGNDLRDPWDR